MSYQPDHLIGIQEFCRREGQPCESLEAVQELLTLLAHPQRSKAMATLMPEFTEWAKRWEGVFLR